MTAALFLRWTITIVSRMYCRIKNGDASRASAPVSSWFNIIQYMILQCFYSTYFDDEEVTTSPATATHQPQCHEPQFHNMKSHLR